MTPLELASDLRTRINPAYATQLGTESYERRLCAEALEAQATRLDALVAAIKKMHSAKGRYHTQLATCDLYDLVGLSNTRPEK